MLAPAAEVYKVAHEFDFPLIRGMLLRETETMTPAQVYSYKKRLGIEMNRVENKNNLKKVNFRQMSWPKWTPTIFMNSSKRSKTI